jgi:CRP-like cAMP-binding protein
MQPTDFPLLRDADRAQVEAFLDECKLCDYAAGQELMAQGSRGRSCYFLLSGSLRVVVPSRWDERELALLSAPAVVGEMELLTGEPRSASVIVLADARLLEVPFEMFRRRMNEGDATAMRVLAGMARVVALRLAALDKKISEDEVPGGSRSDELLRFQHQLFSEWSF